MKISKFTSTYLSASDLREMGPQLVLIDSCEEEEVGNVAKPVLRGDDPKHVFALNPTNIQSICEILGSDETDDWHDQLIVAYYDPTVVFNNRKVGGIRFRKPKPNTAKPARRQRTVAAGASVDDAPF